MSVDQLTSELKALSATERQQILNAVLSDEVVYAVPATPASDKSVAFVERWKGKFSLPERDLEDARLNYLLDRHSSERSVGIVHA